MMDDNKINKILPKKIPQKKLDPKFIHFQASSPI